MVSTRPRTGTNQDGSEGRAWVADVRLPDGTKSRIQRSRKREPGLRVADRVPWLMRTASAGPTSTAPKG
jgi:hypothetical protein